MKRTSRRPRRNPPLSEAEMKMLREVVASEASGNRWLVIDDRRRRAVVERLEEAGLVTVLSAGTWHDAPRGRRHTVRRFFWQVQLQSTAVGRSVARR